MSVLDSSAVLAFVQQEPGQDLVEEAMLAGASIAATNWSEVHQKCLRRGADWPTIRDTILAHDVLVVPVDQAIAEAAAQMWRPGQNLSLADRCCLALGHAEGAPVLTGDGEWGTEEPVVQIR